MTLYDHPDWRGFVAAIRAAPGDDVPRLAAADWLDEHGQRDRAELVRAMVGRERERGQAARRLTFRAKRLLATDPLVPGVRVKEVRTQHPRWGRLFVHAHPAEGWGGYVLAHIDRGFAREVVCPSAWWLAHGAAVLAREPVLEVNLTDWPAVEARPAGGGISARLVGGPPGLLLPAGTTPETMTAALLAAGWPGVPVLTNMSHPYYRARGSPASQVWEDRPTMAEMMPDVYNPPSPTDPGRSVNREV